jgi:hypothetical protein
MKSGRQMIPLKMTSTPLFYLVASAIPNWRTFKHLRWVQRNPLLTFEEIGGFG